MIQYFIRRLLTTIPVLILVMIVVFFIIHLIPGDPILGIIAGRPASDLVIENLRHKMGLDMPFAQQFIRYMTNAFKGDFGTSFIDRCPVVEKYLHVAPYSVQLALGSLVISIVVGVSLGTIAGVFPGTWLDTGIMAFAIAGVSLPGFFTGLLLIYLFSLTLHWFPVLGSGFKGLILPSISTGLWAAGNIARLARSSILEVIREDYIRTARAKGLSMATVVGKHALRNAMIPVLTFLGMQLATNLGGLAITETVFNRPGVGRMLVDAVIILDYPVVQFGVLLITGVFIIMSLLVDLLYGIVDPRITYM